MKAKTSLRVTIPLMPGMRRSKVGSPPPGNVIGWHFAVTPLCGSILDFSRDNCFQTLMSLSIGELLESVELFSRFETDCLSGSDGDFSTCPRIAPHTCFAGFYGKDAETAKFNAVAFGKALLH